MGSAVADAEADADTEEEADVGVAVTLTLKTVVTTVVNEEIWLLEVTAVVSVVVAVVRDRETLADEVEEAELEELGEDDVD